MTDDIDEPSDKLQPRLYSVVLPPGSRTAGRTLHEIELARFHVDVTAVRQRNFRDSAPRPETRLSEGDVIALRGRQEDLIVAEMYLVQGGGAKK